MAHAYIPLRAVRLACRWVAERATPLQIPAVVSRAEPVNHGVIILLDKVSQ